MDFIFLEGKGTELVKNPSILPTLKETQETKYLLENRIKVMRNTISKNQGKENAFITQLHRLNTIKTNCKQQKQHIRQGLAELEQKELERQESIRNKSYRSKPIKLQPYMAMSSTRYEAKLVRDRSKQNRHKIQRFKDNLIKGRKVTVSRIRHGEEKGKIKRHEFISLRQSRIKKDFEESLDKIYDYRQLKSSEELERLQLLEHSLIDQLSRSRQRTPRQIRL